MGPRCGSCTSPLQGGTTEDVDPTFQVRGSGGLSCRGTTVTVVLRRVQCVGDFSETLRSMEFLYTTEVGSPRIS